ncbi:LptF/LptG family permease [Fulvimarina sp. 2208YS6-2-32]|uniref:LptF/LptG family permease n=1 Tax=Fulvimarina uroteuthidis TaxID=3098149 RepID=A0ABU5I515_9HYPH|nr:LptF/LptG family permease [Fulvimarina sp. 2208YS6-2-32]MDY8110467.1 LptF/LptG family permease [Fulvimarina sp. 2208YS6-2-32]
MTLLERYIFRRALISSAGALVSLSLIVWIVQALSRIDIVKTSASAAGNILWIALMLLPDLAAGVVPFAILIGAIQTLNGLNADSERAVISASGGSMMIVARPILLLGFLGGLLTLTVAHGLGPMASAGFYNGIRSINVDTITVFLRPGRFERVQSDLVLSVGESNGGTIKSLFIQDTRDPQLDLTYFAKEAAIIDNEESPVLMLFDGQLHRKERESGSISVIEFQTYAFDLADLKPATEERWTRTSEQSTLQLLTPDVNDPSYQRQPGRNVEELADRFTSWLYCIVFALWAVAVAGQPQTNRQASSAAMTFGLAGAIGLKALGFVTLSFVGDNPSSAVFVFAVPIVAAILDIVLIRRGLNFAQLAIVQTIVDWPRRISLMLGRRSKAGPADSAGRAGS